MDLQKVSDEEKLAYCRKYFLLGFALLPFLWLVNVIWFFKQAFIRLEFSQQKVIRKYVVMSAVGFLTWSILFVAWQVVFLNYRVSWGWFGDQLSFTFPLGFA